MTPPAIRKLSTEIPKKLNSNCPEKENKTIVTNETKDAFGLTQQSWS